MLDNWNNVIFKLDIGIMLSLSKIIEIMLFVIYDTWNNAAQVS